MNNEETTKEEEHYVCLGGCRGTSPVPGVCQTPDCVKQDNELEKCDCRDEKHNDFQPAL